MLHISEPDHDGKAYVQRRITTITTSITTATTATVTTSSIVIAMLISIMSASARPTSRCSVKAGGQQAQCLLFCWYPQRQHVAVRGIAVACRTTTP